VFTAPEDVKNSILLFNKGKNQIFLTKTTSNKKLDDLLGLSEKKTYLINLSENDIVFGREIKYKRVVREYKLVDVDGLREVTMKNKIQYRKDKKKWGENNKQGNGYG